MNFKEIKQNAFAMPYCNPAYPKGPYRFKNREYFIISYLTDPEKLSAVVPEPLHIDPLNPIVHYEFIRMPDSSGFGNYTESGQVITVLDENGRKGNYTHNMYLDDEGPIAAGREIWGFPKKLASPKLVVETDTLIGTLNYGSVRVATGTMGFKYEPIDILEEQEKMMNIPNFLLKIIPHVDGSARICELVKYYLKDVVVKESYTGPVALELFNHALAPVYELPILKIVGAKHIIANLTLGLGEVVLDYLNNETTLRKIN